jgi:hypothetical protein
MRHLLRLAGFSIEAEFSDFQGSRPAYGKEQIWIAHKNSGAETRECGHAGARPRAAGPGGPSRGLPASPKSKNTN